MANAFAKDLELMFEKVVEGYDAACVVSKEADTFYPSGTEMQRAGNTFYVRQNYHQDIVTGLDVSAATPSDIIDRFVPATFRTPDNVVNYFDAYELRDERIMSEAGEAAALRLAAEVDKNLVAAAKSYATIFVKKVGALAWTDGANAEALMLSRGIVSGQKKLFLNPFDYLSLSSDLGNKAYMSDWSKDAYEKSRIPDIAGFKSFRTDTAPTLAGVGTVTGTTVTANTSHTVTAMTGDVPTDNRIGTLGVSGANIANIKNGDRFTIANVNAVHMIDKSDTGQLQTFTVISGGGTATLTVSPKIVVSGPYQNVTVQAAAGAAITFQNTATKPINLFLNQGALRLDYGRLAFPGGAGAMVKTATTAQGVPIVQVAQIDAKTGKLFVRHTMLYATSVPDPEKLGMIVANQ